MDGAARVEDEARLRREMQGGASQLKQLKGRLQASRGDKNSYSAHALAEIVIAQGKCVESERKHRASIEALNLEVGGGKKGVTEGVTKGIMEGATKVLAKEAKQGESIETRTSLPSTPDIIEAGSRVVAGGAGATKVEGRPHGQWRR